MVGWEVLRSWWYPAGGLQVRSRAILVCVAEGGGGVSSTRGKFRNGP